MNAALDAVLRLHPGYRDETYAMVRQSLFKAIM